MTQRIDRSQWPTQLHRSFAAADAADAEYYASLTPVQRLEMVEQLRKQAWSPDGLVDDGRELSRHVERIVRGGR